MDSTNESKSSAKSSSKKQKVVASQDEMNFVEDPAKKDFHAKRRALKSKAKLAKETPKQTPKKYKKKGKKTKSNKGNQLKTKHSGKMDESVVPLATFYESMSFRIGCGVIAAISVIMVIVYFILYHF